MNSRIPILGLLLVGLTACVSSEYVGKTFPPTQSVDMYFSFDDIDQPYEVMGMIEGHGTEFDSYEHMEEEMVKDAMEKGADGIVFLEMDVVVTGQTTTASAGEDATWYVDASGDLKKRKRTESTEVTTDIRERIIKAQLVKYQEG